MSDVKALETLQTVQFVVDQEGRPSAVQMGIEAWEALLDWLEDIEDRALVRTLIPRLRQGPQQAGALRWEQVRTEWDAPEPERGSRDDAA
jgi:hypothetical protein